MAILAAARARLRLIAVTDGEGSHPGSDPAVTGFPDRGVSGRPGPAGRAGGRSDPAAAPGHRGRRSRGRTRGLLRELCAGFEVCLAPWEGDAHADHEAAGRAARRAARGDGRTVLATRSGCGTGRDRLTRRSPGTGPAGYRYLPRSQPGSDRPSGPSPASSPTAGRPWDRCCRTGSWRTSPESRRCCCDDRSGDPATLGAGYFDAMYEAARTRGASRTGGMSGANTRSASHSSRTGGTAAPSSPAAPSAC